MPPLKSVKIFFNIKKMVILAIYSLGLLIQHYRQSSNQTIVIILLKFYRQVQKEWL